MNFRAMCKVFLKQTQKDREKTEMREMGKMSKKDRKIKIIL